MHKQKVFSVILIESAGFSFMPSPPFFYLDGRAIIKAQEGGESMAYFDDDNEHALRHPKIDLRNNIGVLAIEILKTKDFSVN